MKKQFAVVSAKVIVSEFASKNERVLNPGEMYWIDYVINDYIGLAGNKTDFAVILVPVGRNSIRCVVGTRFIEICDQADFPKSYCFQGVHDLNKDMRYDREPVFTQDISGEMCIAVLTGDSLSSVREVVSKIRSGRGVLSKLAPAKPLTNAEMVSAVKKMGYSINNKVENVFVDRSTAEPVRIVSPKRLREVIRLYGRSVLVDCMIGKDRRISNSGKQSWIIVVGVTDHSYPWARVTFYNPSKDQLDQCDFSTLAGSMLGHGFMCDKSSVL